VNSPAPSALSAAALGRGPVSDPSGIGSLIMGPRGVRRLRSRLLTSRSRLLTSFCTYELPVSAASLIPAAWAPRA
jgi:hypothetical protein